MSTELVSLLHPVVLRHSFWLYFASASLLVGTFGFFPVSPITSNWYGWISLGFLAGGIFYLILSGEFGRLVFGPETWRTSRILVVGGLAAAFIGSVPSMVNAYADLLLGIEYAYPDLISSVEGIIVGMGLIVASIGLFLEWKRLPNLVDESARKALSKMNESGFGIDDSKLWIGIDSGLVDYGWFYAADDDSVILLSPASVYSKEGVGLFQTMIHEMCHVYLTQTKHASHLEETYEEIGEKTAKKFPQKWRSKVLRSAMAYPWNAYAEDLTFKMLEDSQPRWAKMTIGYFEQTDATARTIAISKRRRMWGNALLLLRNCYRAAVMERYHMPDPTGIVKKANDRLLSKLPPEASVAFDYFHDTFIGLRDDITAEGYKKMLEDYLSKFAMIGETGTRNIP